MNAWDAAGKAVPKGVKAALRRTVGRKPRKSQLPLAHEPHPGAPPGTLVLDEEADRPHIGLIDYDAEVLAERTLGSIDECVPYLTDERPSVTWIDVRGIGHRETFEKMGRIFRLHPLALEDVVNVPQRPKADTFPDQQLLIGRMVRVAEGELRTEQVSILFGKDFVLTIQEDPDGDVFDCVRARLRKGTSSLRAGGPDYLAYSLLDAVIDGFFPVLERYSEQLEEIELKATDPRCALSRPIHDVKRDLLTIRRAIWPQRDLINALLRDESPHIRPETRVYLRDTYDHAVQIMDMVETHREVASGLMDLHFSSVSNRTNEIMKVLTILSSIFLPLTFIAGVYGMNFDPKASPLNMPELEWRYGYPFSLALMLASVVGLLYYYRRKGWLGGPPRP